MFHMDFCVVLAKQSHIQLHEDVMSLRGVGVLGLRLLSAEPVWHPADVAGSPRLLTLKSHRRPLEFLGCFAHSLGIVDSYH